MVPYPPEPIYEEPVENYTQATQTDRKVHNQHLKVNWQNRYKKIDEIGILCGDKPWEHCEQKNTSLFYLFIAKEGRCIFKSNHHHFHIEKEPLKEFWRVMEGSFTKTRNITYDRFVVFSFKKQKGESVESIKGHLIEQAEICSLGDEETTPIRNAFILNIQGHDTQRELLKKIVSRIKAPEIAIRIEMRAQIQQIMNQNLTTKAQSVKIVNNFEGRNRNTNYQQSRKDFTRYPTVPQNSKNTSIFTNCGQK